jgi:ureidoacrylate peracid hydrolase
MHKIEIAQDILARAKRMRGRDHIFDVIDSVKTAHIIVDLQVGFMEQGAPVEVPVAREIVGNVNRISAAIRSAGGINVYLRYKHDPNEPMKWTAAESYSGGDYAGEVRKAFTPGNRNFELWPSLDVQPSDLVVDKTRYSGFIPGTSALHDLLRARGIDTLIISGTLTNCCCESTARDAMQMNYKIIFGTDTNAAITDAEHNATLNSMAAIFADVMPVEKIISVIQDSTVAAASAA